MSMSVLTMMEVCVCVCVCVCMCVLENEVKAPDMALTMWGVACVVFSFDFHTFIKNC